MLKHFFYYTCTLLSPLLSPRHVFLASQDPTSIGAGILIIKDDSVDNLTL